MGLNLKTGCCLAALVELAKGRFHQDKKRVAVSRHPLAVLDVEPKLAVYHFSVAPMAMLWPWVLPAGVIRLVDALPGW